MPNIVNNFLMGQLESDFKSMGSCVIVNFDKLTVKLTNEMRTKLRDSGVRYRVVKNRLAIKAFAGMGLDLKTALTGKCGVIFAEEEGAISAAKLIRDFGQQARRELKAKTPPVVVTGGVIEGSAITGPAAEFIADMPDKNTVRSMLLSALLGPARGLAMCLNGVPGGLARCIKAHHEEE
ncbi:MAG: 50S ribosomal protein L10 [Planctomycetes bacterium]|nr:50S ribosomal protein L10 [Planctomycetota bacterium]MCB9889733.1 50S ribosomal protein L10 [Planctomycetota bacterium]